jgi:hypothetical protein
MLNWHLLFFAILTITGCVSSLGNRNAMKVQDIDWPLGELRAVAASVLPVGQRAASPNGREILSRHFTLEGARGYKPAGDATERYFASILILGDRRPYNVEILVTLERRVLRGNQFTYVIEGFDARLAKELERKFRLELTKRREDLNIIDDFRVF